MNKVCKGMRRYLLVWPQTQVVVGLVIVTYFLMR